MTDQSYDMPWRPNYEAVSIAGWMLATGSALLAEHFSSLPPGPFYYIAAMSAAMMLYRVPPAIGLHSRKRALRGRKLSFLDVGRLHRRIKAHKDQLWWGHGFEWTQSFAQQAYQLLRIDRSEIVPSVDEEMGQHWVHGLSLREQDIYQPLDHIAGHTLIVGTTGAGKTRMFDLLVTQAVLRGEAVIIIDPKGDKDLQRTARRACALAHQPDRFVHFHPAFPERSVRINPLQNFTRSTEPASRVAALIPSETGADPFKAFGQMALNNIVQGLLATNKRPSLVLLRRYLEGGPEKIVTEALQAYFEEKVPGWHHIRANLLRSDANTEDKASALVGYYRNTVQEYAPTSDLEGLIGMWEHERVHFSKMIASLMPVLNMLTAGDMGPLLSPDPSDLDDPRIITDNKRIINDAMVAYIGLDSLTDAMVGSAIGAMYLADLTAVAGDRYNFQVGTRPVNIFVDEAAEVICDPFIQLLNKGRGAKMRVFVATQTFADFIARMGSEAKSRQVLANINNVVALRVLDGETQEYIVESFPKTSVNQIMRTQGISTHSENPGMFAGNHGERLIAEEADLFPAQLLGILPNLEYIAKLSGGRIVKGRIPILTSKLDDTMSELPAQAVAIN